MRAATATTAAVAEGWYLREEVAGLQFIQVGVLVQARRLLCGRCTTRLFD